MIEKLAIWTCPKVGCPSVAWKIGTCPRHPGETLRRVVYVRQGDKGDKHESLGDAIARLYGQKGRAV